MKIRYIPNSGFQIGSENFNWIENRKCVRQKIQNQYKGDDRIIEMSEFSGRDQNHDIEQRRDIYKDINNLNG